MKEFGKSRVMRVLAVLLLLVMIASCVICTPIINASAATGGGEGTWVEGNPQRVTSTWSYYRAGVDASYSDYLYYDIYLPAGYDDSKEYSLLLFLHGSLYAQSSQYAFARFLKFNAVADANDIIVIYPRQSIDLNFTHSWNFWAHTDQCRTKGYTPDAMVSYVKKAINTYNINEDNVFAAGFSAGGAYSIALLSMYPEVFSAACSSSGIPFKTTGCALDAVAAMYDNTAWGGYETNTNTLASYVNSAFKTAGVSEPRRLMVIHGTADSLVTYNNGERSAETWVKAMQKYDSSLSLTPDFTATYTSAGGATYDVELYGGTTPETSTVAFYTVQGMDHAWSGSTAGTTSYGFALGPSTNELMWRFFTGSYNQPVDTGDEITGSSAATLPQTAISGSFNHGSGRKINNISTSTTFTLEYANISPDYFGMYKDPYYSAYFCYDIQAIMDKLPELAENYERKIETITVSANVSKGKDANGYVSNAVIYFQTSNSAWTGTSNYPKSGYKVGDGTYGSDWTSCGNIKFDIWSDDLGTGRYLTLKLSYEFGVWVMFPNYMTMTSDIPQITVNYVDTYVEPVDAIQSVEYDIDENNKLSFKVVTDAPYTEVKLMNSADVDTVLATSSSYTVNENGFNEFTMTVDAPAELTMYYIDCGKNGTYIEQYYSCIVEGIAPPVVEDAIKSVSHEFVGDDVVFTVVTAPAALNRVKVALATNASKYLAYTSSYTVDANGDYVWTIKTDSPVETTEYAFDVRNSDTGMYEQNYFLYTVEVAVDEPVIKSVTPVVDGGKLVFTVVTASGNYNRLRVGPNTSTVGNLANSSNYKVDANGDYVWTISIDVPANSTNLYFDLRDAATNKFIGECYHYYLDVAKLPNGSKISDVTAEYVDGKLVFTAVTSDDVNRVKLSLASDTKSYIKYTNNYTVDANGNYVWTISIDAPSATTEYALDARVISTGKYTGKQYTYTYNYDPAIAANKSIISVSHKIASGNLVFEVVTKPVANRVKVSLTSDLSTYLKYSNNYTVDVNGNYVWTITVDAPTKVTSYSFDSRNPETSKYYKDYFVYEVDPSKTTNVNDDSVIKYITHTVVNGKVEFTVTTVSGDFNRVKVADTEGNLLDYVSSYSVAENGYYVWKMSVDVPSPIAATSYVFDVRSASTNKYLKLGYTRTLTESDFTTTNEGLTTHIKSVEAEEFTASNTDKLVFTVVTTSEVNRVKVAYASDPKSYVAYTSKYTVDGDYYVWTISIDKPLYSTAFVVDVRLAGTTVYTRDYASYNYIVDMPDAIYWNTIDANGIYTAENGGFQFDAHGWLLYNQYGITLVASNGYPTSCASISVYAPDDATVFENKTVDEFEAVLGTEISSFTKTTIGDGYTCYIAKSADGAYFTYVFQTEFNKYFVNFIQAADGVNVAAIAESIMSTIVIYG